MLPRSKRVSKKLFGDVLTKGKSFHSPHFSLKAYSSKTPSAPRFSVVVPKKVEKTAVRRNSIRRRALAIVRKNISDIKEQGIMGVFFAKSGSYGLSKEEYGQEIASLLTKIA